MNRKEEIKKAEENLRQDMLARWSLITRVTTDAAFNAKDNLAAQLGLFLVYTQRMEDELHQILSLMFSFKSFTRGKKTYAYVSIEKLKWDDLTLGRTLEILKSVAIKDSKTGEDLLKPVLQKITTFNGTRKGYVHKILNDRNLKDLNMMREDVVKSNKELLTISRELLKVLERLRDLYEIDSSFESVEKHGIFKS